MENSALLLFEWPWDLVNGNFRTIHAKDTEGVKLDGRVATLIMSQYRDQIEVNGDPRQVVTQVKIPKDGWAPKIVWNLALPLHKEEEQAIGFQGWSDEKIITRKYKIGRPPHIRSDDGTDLESLQKTEDLLTNFLQVIVARMHDFDDLKEKVNLWERVIELWLEPKNQLDPTKDIIVKHAEEYRHRWEEIAKQPRRLLGRTRELVSLASAEELDAQCMQWLSHQPGDSVVERAGGRQRIMALTRHENCNTLENRVFRDLLWRSQQAALDYLLFANRYPTDTSRSDVVKHYKSNCLDMEKDLSTLGVTRLEDHVQANYVLLHDERYRNVWIAWQDLMRRERAKDDLWRWQHRSWEEFCKTLVACSLNWIHGANQYFASPLLVRAEHHCGHWLIHDDPMVVVAHWDKNWATELLSAHADDVPIKYRELCASFWLRCTRLDIDHCIYIPVWAIHALDGKPSLTALVTSAESALSRMRYPNLSNGIVLVSHIDPGIKNTHEKKKQVVGYAFGPDGEQLPKAIDVLSDQLPDLFERALCVH